MRRLKNILLIIKEAWRLLGEGEIGSGEGYFFLKYKDLGFYVESNVVRLYSKRLFIIDNRLLCNNRYKDNFWVNTDYLEIYYQLSNFPKPPIVQIQDLSSEYESKTEVPTR